MDDNFEALVQARIQAAADRLLGAYQVNAAFLDIYPEVLA